MLEVHGKSNLVVRGLRFQHAASGLQESAVEISDATNVLVEDNEFSWNGWDGTNFIHVRNFTTRRNVSTYNGGSGRTAAYVKNFLSEDDTTSFNNRRGLRGNFLYWSVAGTKYLHMHEAIIRRHTAKGNHAAGLWLDTDNENILIENSRWCGNLKTGLFLEASQGPIVVNHSFSYQNQEWGIRGIASKHIYLQENEIHNNSGFQIRIPTAPARYHENWETGIDTHVQSAHWIITGNTISGDIALLEIPTTGRFLSTLYSSKNLWHIPKSPYLFKIGTEDFNFPQWHQHTGQDEDSKLDETKSIGLPKDCAYQP